MSLTFSLSLKNKDFEIRRNILIELRKHLDETLQKAAPVILKDTKHLIKKYLTAQAEYKELTSNSGILRELFGLDVSKHQPETIVDILVNSTNVKSIKAASSSTHIIRGGLQITAIDASYQDILQSAASFSDVILEENIAQASNLAIHWLDYLLTYGNAILRSNYTVGVDINNNTHWVRRDGDSIKVPSWLSGTATDNWITRALENIDVDLLDIIEKRVLEYW